MKIQINLNEVVKVKLTERGKEIHKKIHEDIRKEAPHLIGEYKGPIVDAEGYTKYQLWELMGDFGSQMFNGSPPCFEGNNIIIDTKG